MLKVLIVDDDYTKIANITKIINFSEIEINIDNVDNITGAREKMKDTVYDLVLLDMNIPTYFGGDPEPYGGMELIEKIKTKQIKYVPSHIIATTAYENILNDFKEELSSNLLAVIHYDSDIDDWHNPIINKIKYIQQTKNNTYDHPFKKYDIAIIAALENPELEAIYNLPDTNWNDIVVPGDTTAIYKESKIKTMCGKELNIVISFAPRMGMTSSAISTSKICMHFQPDYLFMTGIAAGIKGDKRNFGDILVSQTSWDWGSGKIYDDNGEEKFSPDHAHVTLDEDIEIKLRSLIRNEDIFENLKKLYKPRNAPETPLRLHIGPIASGAQVIQNIETVNGIKDYNRKIIGIDMEIHGVMLASRYSSKFKPKAICIKSICDFGDKEKADNWQEYASFTSANFIHYFIQNHLYL